MRYISEKYLSESRNFDGEVSHISLHYEEDFNWAYDIVDDIAVNDPERRAMVWCNPEGEEHVFTFADMKRWSDKTANMLAGHGIGCAGKTAVQLKKSDYDKYDYFIGMDTANIRNMNRIFGGDKDGKICKLLTFADRGDDVSDPWYSRDFGKAYADIEEGCKGLFAKLMDQI